ncbi:folylpolyglutamate synthase/dihydrofolate synthase family protein [Kamptonema cortianum]|nr:folylpolyglutamate synthase/dihydrofolate synthase family protein [Geitlerinema splendidum]MDK3158380.1 folylpolyglutamate synthase/dihydrofolate synthase family protein [Kamptonema cortianum]
MLSYVEAVEALRAMSHRGWRLGLDRMHEMCERLGVPRGGNLKYIHVAGTNGKGSVTKFVQNILTLAGHKTGSCYSPYVYDLRERVQVDGVAISEESFALLMTEIVLVSESLTPTKFEAPTEFEAKIALGFLYWNQLEADFVALETGLGGRLDATNVVDSAVSVITSIGLDHTEILGDTLEKIAAEKAGIIKPGKPCVMSDLPEDARCVIRERCRELEAPLYEHGKHWDIESSDPDPLEMPGAIQRLNAKAAIVACKLVCPDLTENQLKLGIETAKLPGRFEVLECQGKTWIFDGAHNEQATTHLVATMQERFPNARVSVLFGMLDGHDPEPVVRQLSTVAHEMVTVPINWTRTCNPEDLAEVASKYFSKVSASWSVSEGLEKLTEEVVLVTGSFYLLAEVARALGTIENIG